MELDDICTALSDETRRQLVLIINANGPLSSSQSHKIFKQRYGDLRRESVYKALERLVSAGILYKEYDSENGIVYHLSSNEITLDLANMSAIATDTQTKGNR